MAERRVGWRVALAAIAAMAVAVAGCSSEDDAGDAGSDDATTTAAAGSEEAAPNGPSGGCEAEPAEPGTTLATIESGGEERTYQLTVPPEADGTTPLPLVFTLHALTVDHKGVPSLSGLTDEGGAGLYVVSPSGRLGPTGAPYWDAAPVPGNPDADFLAALLDQMEDQLCVDTGRVFSIGMSNGAQMSSLIACRFGDRLAGIVPIAGVEFNDPCDGSSVPVVAFHGDADPIVPFEGGGLNSVTIADQNYYRGEVPPSVAVPTGVEESMAGWAEHNGCEPEPQEEAVSDEVRHLTWQGCDARTELYVVVGGGHQWPGRPQAAFESQFGPGTTDVDATAIFLDLVASTGS
jgi:polyhydroxybutyrate depolymerase